MDPEQTLARLVSDGIVDAVIQRIKTGKEAEVFVVRKGTEYLAAKVYKERTQRNFKNNAAYKEGRIVRNTRDARAVAKNTKYGRNLAESDWRHAEHDALVTLAAAGCRVPRAELFYEDTLLMELVLDSHGQPAPRLIECALTPEEASTFHRDLIGQVVKMLACDLIHGDLSPYNVLLGWNGPTIIDLPQVLKAAHNSQSEQFLVRDVRNLTEFFARFVPTLRSRVNDGYAIWRRYVRRELAPDYFPDEGEGLAAKPIDDARRKHGKAHRHPGPQRAAHAGPPAAPHPPKEHHVQGGAAPAHKPVQPAPAHPPHAAPRQPHHGPRPHPANPAAANRPHPQPHKPHPAAERHAGQAANTQAGHPRRPGPPPKHHGQARQTPTPGGPEIVRVSRPHDPMNGQQRQQGPGDRKGNHPGGHSPHHRRRP